MVAAAQNHATDGATTAPLAVKRKVIQKLRCLPSPFNRTYTALTQMISDEIISLSR
jgi:hypothetical protein